MVDLRDSRRLVRDSAWKNACCQAWWSEFDSYNLHGRWRESLQCLYTHHGMYTPPQHTHTNNNFFLFQRSGLECVILFVCFVLLWGRVSLCSCLSWKSLCRTSCPRTHRDLPASATFLSVECVILKVCSFIFKNAFNMGLLMQACDPS